MSTTTILTTVGTAILRQVPWEKLTEQIAMLVLERLKRGKIKKLSNAELVKKTDNTKTVLDEINKRIKEVK